MEKQLPVDLVRNIMSDFAEQTGLSPVRSRPQRYLWTDAFAVCNFLELYRQTGDASFKALALALVDQVHETLGRYRPDDSRSGWLSGMDEEEGKLHPTAGGLRIGKKMNERGPSDPLDEEMEWERDGQYYHYLTKWMHALHCVATIISEEKYHRWARELAKRVHAGFIFTSPFDGRQYLHWKMSVDLSRPLVPSMGQHDPLEGFITYSHLQSHNKSEEPQQWSTPDLSTEIKELADICRDRSWTTEDPLGLGGLLCNALQLAQLMINDRSGQDKLLLAMLDSSLLGLASCLHNLLLPARYRLAFREFGLSIGLHAVKRMQRLIEKDPEAFKDRETLYSRIEKLLVFQEVGIQIEQFWLEEANRAGDSWQEHSAINMVMLATSLAPDGFLQTL